MSGNTVRQQAISKVSTFISSSPPLNYKEVGSGTQFGANVFGLNTMKAHLPKDAVLGVPETMYPEYRKKIKDTYVRPEPCKADCGATPPR